MKTNKAEFDEDGVYQLRDCAFLFLGFPNSVHVIDVKTSELKTLVDVKVIAGKNIHHFIVSQEAFDPTKPSHSSVMLIRDTMYERLRGEPLYAPIFINEK